MRWHIFCKVIDNYGDIGVCWRLSCELARRGEPVRLWVDDPSALAWMAPAGCTGVEVMTWSEPLEKSLNFPSIFDCNVIIESFGCTISPEYIANYLDYSTALMGQSFKWVNLEYISTEPYVEKNHGLPSPVLTGPGKGLTKHFFYPGFTARTGGLLREPDLLQRQAVFDRVLWFKEHSISCNGERLVSLFCYEPKALGALLAQLANGPMPVKLLVTHGRARQAVEAWFAGRTGRACTPTLRGQLSFVYLPALTQIQYDELLWACDLNFVRGEDSLVRAIWAGKPFVWNIYPQDDNAHHAKLEAFLEMLGANDSLWAFHRVWNALDPQNNLPPLDLPSWHEIALAARERLLAQTDLTTQLRQFVALSPDKNKQ